MAIPNYPACELDALELPCTTLFDEGLFMLSALLAEIAPGFVGDCEPIRGLIAHQAPVTTESDYLALWFVGETEAPAGNGFNQAGFSTVEVRWQLRLVESGYAHPFALGAGGVHAIDLDLVHAQTRVLMAHGELLRQGIKSLIGRAVLLPDSCTRARLVSFAPAAAGLDTPAGNAGWQAVIAYTRTS